MARQAHDMAIMVRDRKITAQISATVAQAHLALGDTTAAVQWFEDCLTIAHNTYPFIETRALVGLATAQLATGDPTSATDTAERAATIATACGFRLLEEQASAAMRAAKR